MRKLFTFAFALFATVAMNAQDVDTSSWQEGDDIASYLNWGDYDGTWSGGKTANNNGDYSIDDMGSWWKGSKPSEWNEVDGTAAVGFYFDGKQDTDKLTNVYQVIYFPAGFYTIKVQALYREGTPIDNFTNHFNKVIKKNAWLYADVLTSEDPESEVTTSYETYVRSLATSEQTEGRLYTETGSWKNDYQYDYKDKETGETTSYYCPCCLPGAIAYFAAGKYENELKIILPEGAYVRLGFRKTANITQDWLVFTNFRIVYNGEADEDAKLELAVDQFDDLYASVEEVRDNIDAKGYGALAGIVGDQLMEIEGVVEKDNYASVLAGIDKLNKLAEDANNALLVAYSLADLIESSHDMIVSTDFPGKGEFETKLDNIETKASTDDPAEIDNDVNAYNIMYEELSAARADYLNTGDPDEYGAKDFTSLIKYPWFVNPEYTPTQNEDGTWTLKEETWQWGDVQGPGSYADKKADRTDIADKVVLSADETVTNQWYKVFNQTSGWSPGLGLYYIGGLIGVSDGWNGGLIGTMEIRQQLVGLPKGYYSIKALLRGNGTDATNTWNENNLPPYHNIFAVNSDEVRVASMPGHTDSYLSSNGWYEWNPNVWTEHKTGIISALDGRLLIGGQSSMVACYTGFRLLFYGENPNYSPMIQEEIDAIYTLMNESLIEQYSNVFAGDTLHVIDLINSIEFPVSTKEGYEAAFATTNEAKDYLQKVVNAMKSYTLAKDYDDLYAKYTDPNADGFVDGPTQAAILEKPMEYIASLGASEADTYEKIAPAKDIYNAYKSYLSTYDKAAALDEPELKELMATQSADLKANYRDVATLNQYETAINFLVKRATILAAGGKNASESNPVEVTSLINNPDFTSSASSGWSGNTGTSNEYARGNSEVWNANPLDMYQVIKGLPEGKYEIRVRALYRDARNVRDNKNQSWTSYWTDAKGDVNAWERHFAQFYATTVTSANDTIDEFAYVKSVCDGLFTAPSFTKYYRNNSSDLVEGDLIIDPETGEETAAIDTIWTVAVPEDDLYDDDDELITSWTDEETGKVYTVVQDGPDYRYVFQDENGTPQFAWQIENTYPFDERIKGDDGVFYFYPSSMLGAYYRFDLNPEAYCNKVQIEVAAGGDLRIGFRKNTDPKIEGDWVIFDDFQLFYLGGDLDKKPDTGIKDVIANNAKSAAIYNLAGQRINALQKGLNIVGGKKVFVK